MPWIPFREARAHSATMARLWLRCCVWGLTHGITPPDVCRQLTSVHVHVLQERRHFTSVCTPAACASISRLRACASQARTRVRRVHALHERAYTAQACMHITGVHALLKGAPTSTPHKCAVSFRTRAYTTQVCIHSTRAYALHKRTYLHRRALAQRCAHNSQV